MNASLETQTIDLTPEDFGEPDGFKLTSAQMAVGFGIPFAIVRYRGSLNGWAVPAEALRLDMGKRIFLDDLAESPLKEAAMRLSEYLGNLQLRQAAARLNPPTARTAPEISR